MCGSTRKVENSELDWEGGIHEDMTGKSRPKIKEDFVRKT
jgi:hypothetical protein